MKLPGLSLGDGKKKRDFMVAMVEKMILFRSLMSEVYGLTSESQVVVPCLQRKEVMKQNN